MNPTPAPYRFHAFEVSYFSAKVRPALRYKQLWFEELRADLAEVQRRTGLGFIPILVTPEGETWQDSSTAEMVFDVATIVAFASRTITLEPGDVIATGTPAGVGHYQSPPRYLAEGDVMRCEIDGIGAVENRIVDERPRLADHELAAGVEPLRAAQP